MRFSIIFLCFGRTLSPLINTDICIIPISFKTKKTRTLLEYRAAAVTFFLFFLATVHFSDDFCENFVHVGPVFSTGLDEGATPAVRQCVPFLCLHLALVLQVNFVGH